MISRQVTMNRVNTYLPHECFKAILVSATKEKAENYSQWITNSSTSRGGIYMCPYGNKSQLVIFPRYPGTFDKQATTVAVEALLVFVDSDEEFQLIKNEIPKYGQIPIRLVISEKNMKHVLKEINAKFFQGGSPDKLKDELHRLDIQECVNIKDKFMQFDTDQSGYIDHREMMAIAASIGENPDTEEFKQAMLALDFNSDGNISFTEFISWWKIGRQNTLTLPKIYQLNVNSKRVIHEVLNYEEYLNTAKNSTGVQDLKTKQNVYYRSPGLFEIRSFVEMAFAVGGEMREKMAADFVGKFNPNKGAIKSNFISILTTLKPGAQLSEIQAKELLDEFKDNVLNFGESSANSVLIGFVKNLLVFETSTAKNSAILAVRLKLDIEELIRGAVFQFLDILEHLHEETESFWFNIKGQSNLDLHDSGNKILGDFLQTSEVLFEGSGFKNKMKNLFDHLTNECKEHGFVKLLQLIFLPNEVDIEYEGDLNELVDEESKRLLNIPLDGISSIMEFLKKSLSPKLLGALDNIEIGVNMFRIFGRIKFYTKSLFNQ
jgi:hypothetical protein